jgi:hypothetical protein
MERIGRGLLEAVLHVPGLRRFVLGVDELDPSADRIREAAKLMRWSALALLRTALVENDERKTRW